MCVSLSASSSSSLFLRVRWALFPPAVSRHIVKGKKFLRRGEDDEAIMWFDFLLPRIKNAYPDLPVYEVTFLHSPFFSRPLSLLLLQSLFLSCPSSSVSFLLFFVCTTPRVARKNWRWWGSSPGKDERIFLVRVTSPSLPTATSTASGAPLFFLPTTKEVITSIYLSWIYLNLSIYLTTVIITCVVVLLRFFPFLSLSVFLRIDYYHSIEMRGWCRSWGRCLFVLFFCSVFSVRERLSLFQQGGGMQS